MGAQVVTDCGSFTGGEGLLENHDVTPKRLKIQVLPISPKAINDIISVIANWICHTHANHSWQLLLKNRLRFCIMQCLFLLFEPSNGLFKS